MSPATERYIHAMIEMIRQGQRLIETASVALEGIIADLDEGKVPTVLERKSEIKLQNFDLGGGMKETTEDQDEKLGRMLGILTTTAPEVLTDDLAKSEELS